LNLSQQASIMSSFIDKALFRHFIAQSSCFKVKTLPRHVKVSASLGLNLAESKSNFTVSSSMEPLLCSRAVANHFAERDLMRSVP